MVLGAAVGRDGTPGPALVRRAQHGAALVNQGVAPLLLLAGGNGEAEALMSVALGMGIPEDAIRLEKASRNTFENARETARIARQCGWRHVVLVTDPWHMPRARMLFRFAGLNVVPAPCGWSGRWSAVMAAVGREALAFPRSIVRCTRFLAGRV